MPNELINEIWSEVSVEGGSRLTMCRREYPYPSEFGRVNLTLHEELRRLLHSGEPLLVFDFSPRDGDYVTGLTAVPKRYAEDTFVFDPLDKERSLSLFGDIAKDAKSNLLKLTHALPLLNKELLEEDVKLKLAGLDGVFKNLFGASQSAVPLYKLVFAYDQNCFDRLLSEIEVNQESYQDARKKMANWFYLFNERSLMEKYLTNPFFVRSLDWTPLWNNVLMFFHLNLRELCLVDAKWMAEVAIISRVHAIVDDKVRPALPRRISVSQTAGISKDASLLLGRFYTQEENYFVLAQEGLDDMSFRECAMIRKQTKDEDLYARLNIVVIDDDCGIINIPHAVKNALDNYGNKGLRTINVYAQVGGIEANTAHAPKTGNLEIASALYQLSRLKWGRPSSEVVAEHLDFLDDLNAKFAPFLNFPYGLEEQASAISRALAYRYLRYESIEDEGEDYPLGNIEDIDSFIKN